MKNLQKYFHPSSLCKYAHVQCRLPNKGQLKVQISKKTTVLLPSMSYYSTYMLLAHKKENYSEYLKNLSAFPLGSSQFDLYLM